MDNNNEPRLVAQDELDPQLESAVAAVLTEPLPRDAIERVKIRASTLDVEPIIVAKNADRSNKWRPSIKLSVLAAGILIAVGAMTLVPSGDALAQVVEQLRRMSTATYIAEETGPQGIVAVARVKAPHQLRLDFQDPSASVSVNNGSTGEMFSYSADSDEVKVTAISKAGANFDILQLLINPDVNAVKSRDANNIADTQLFEIFDGKGRIWVSLQSNLPVRIEMPSPTQQGTTKRIYRDFEWNVPLDEQLFALPTGKRTVRGATLASPTELELIAAFAIRQAFSQEPYEESFLAKSSKPGLRVSQLAYDQSKGPQENFQLQSSKLRDHWATLGISESEARDPALVQQRIDYLSMKLDDWASAIAFKGGWVGKGVRPGEAKPLLWWRSGDRIRVLLADLTIIESESPPASD